MQPLFSLLLALSLLPAVATASEAESAKLFASTPSGPIKVYRNAKYSWSEYCPDSTCDVLRTSSTIRPRKFNDLALAYYYHFSTYEYLKQWQRDAVTAEVIERALKRDGHDSCADLTGKSLAQCEFKALRAETRIQFFFVRFDQGRKSTTEFPAAKVLE